MKTQNPRRQKAFTLVELLVAMAIVMILAALSFGGFKWVSTKQANEKAKIQISLLANALEDYKLENGTYPPSTGDPGSTNVLFMALWQNGVSNPTTAKIYLNELDPASKAQGWIVPNESPSLIRDPWGEEYIYRSPGTINPDFDLISKGQDKLTSDTRSNAVNKDDFTN